ncbi:hypothetical protein, partial [Pseudoalteromonas maricaloris]
QLALGSDNTLQKLSLDAQGTAVDYLVNAHAGVQLSEQLDLADRELDIQLAASGGLTALTLQKAGLTLGDAHTQLSAQVSWQDGLRSQ